MARSRTSSAYSPRPTQRRRYLEPSEIDSENDSEGVSRTNPQPDGNTSPQSTSVSIPKDHPNGIKWFKKSQFGHIFDITDHIKITLTPLWMLLPRAVVTKKKYEMWFVLNGIPIKYSLMEHALISGLNCSAYPEDPCHTGNEFRERVFHGIKKISQNDVKKYLMVQKLDIVAKCKNASEKLTRWNCHAFILPLMLLPFECILAMTPTYAEIREDVKGPVPRICRWKTKFHRQQAAPLEQILYAVGDSTNINSILVPTLEEQKANHMIGFVLYHDDSDAIVDNWATILESGRSIFWEDLLYADLEGRRNFLNGYGERVQGRDRENTEDIIHEQYTRQEGATAAEQTRYLPSNPTVNESIPPQASSHADNSMVLRELQALKQTVEKMSTEHESRFLQLERLIIENGNRVEMLTNIVSRFVQQQSETWKCGDRGESSGGGGEHSRGVDVRIIAGGDFETQDDIYAPTDVCFETEISVERDMEDSPLNEIFYQTSTCLSDKDCEEDILDVGQQKRRPQRHLKKSKYKTTPYTDPGLKKMMFRKGSIKKFDLLCLLDSMRKSFEDYKNLVLKPPFTSSLGITRA
ncbi:hypothetical protein TIFTF001_014119 [Ficus carica]|uniref:DUF1985 domain-containing protein n=1 Tax=Ficus carica TaxID=3494 RepID=A0AA88D7W3_FICCA|nr:hypothetical protein TIFTF001_014119 [Ficus carica]